MNKQIDAEKLINILVGKIAELELENAKLKVGSPPHVRVILKGIFKKILIFGITPACAGNTHWSGAIYQRI